LLAVERRVHEQEARDQLILGMSAALRRLTEALGPLLEVVGPLVDSFEALPDAPQPPPPPRPQFAEPATSIAVAAHTTHAPAIEPERLAAAQARLREAAQQAAQRPVDPPATAGTSAGLIPPPGRRSWLLRALRRMAAHDPESAGRLLVALLPAGRLAQVEPAPALPGAPATVARVVVKGPLRRRIGWEVTQLACELATVSALAKLVRLRASPAQLQAAGVRLDPPLALALVAHAIDPVWTVGHRFALAHLDAGAAYLEVRNGLRPEVRTEAPAGPVQRTVPTEAPGGPVQTTVRCSADAFMLLLAGEAGIAATVEGERRPLELLQGWFGHATAA
jgi:hypothetical protein